MNTVLSSPLSIAHELCKEENIIVGGSVSRAVIMGLPIDAVRNKHGDLTDIDILSLNPNETRSSSDFPMYAHAIDAGGFKWLTVDQSSTPRLIFPYDPSVSVELPDECLTTREFSSDNLVVRTFTPMVQLGLERMRPYDRKSKPQVEQFSQFVCEQYRDDLNLLDPFLELRSKIRQKHPLYVAKLAVKDSVKMLPSGVFKPLRKALR